MALCRVDRENANCCVPVFRGQGEEEEDSVIERHAPWSTSNTHSLPISLAAL